MELTYQEFLDFIKKHTINFTTSQRAKIDNHDWDFYGTITHIDTPKYFYFNCYDMRGVKKIVRWKKPIKDLKKLKEMTFT